MRHGNFCTSTLSKPKDNQFYLFKPMVGLNDNIDIRHSHKVCIYIYIYIIYVHQYSILCNNKILIHSEYEN